MKKAIFIIYCCIVSLKGYGQTYSYSASATGTITISQTMNLSVTTLVGTTTMSSVADYASGKTVDNYCTFAIKGNKPWILQVSVPTLFTAAGGGASSNMPSGSVSVRLNGSATWSTLVNNLSLTGNPGDASVSGNTFNLDFFFNPGYGYSGGNYTLALTYTLSQQ